MSDEPIHVFVGCSANNEDLESQLVLEYSLRKHVTRPLIIHWMKLSRDPESPWYSEPRTVKGWRTEGWATPFSGFRWAVPAVARAYGSERAIYMDSDFIVMADIAELWDQEFASGKVVIARGASRYCCSLWSTTTPNPAVQTLKADPESHHRMNSYYSTHKNLVQPFAGGDWNYTDLGPPPPSLRHPQIKAIHYTRMETQPQLRYAVPRLQATGQKHWFEGQTKEHDWPEMRQLFDQCLNEAKLAGYSIGDYEGELYGAYRIRGAKWKEK